MIENITNIKRCTKVQVTLIKAHRYIFEIKIEEET